MSEDIQYLIDRNVLRILLNLNGAENDEKLEFAAETYEARRSALLVSLMRKHLLGKGIEPERIDEYMQLKAKIIEKLDSIENIEDLPTVQDTVNKVNNEIDLSYEDILKALSEGYQELLNSEVNNLNKLYYQNYFPLLVEEKKDELVGYIKQAAAEGLEFLKILEEEYVNQTSTENFTSSVPAQNLPQVPPIVVPAVGLNVEQAVQPVQPIPQSEPVAQTQEGPQLQPAPQAMTLQPATESAPAPQPAYAEVPVEAPQSVSTSVQIRPVDTFPAN